MALPSVLSIAGSDSSGGAGIQADIKTITAFGAFAQTAITALTAQNTFGVQGVQEATPDFVALQIDSVFDDMRPDAVKIGMVSSPAIVHVIATKLAQHKAENVVVDPVMVATTGAALAKGSAAQAIVEELFPLATVVTPNISEAQVIAGMEIHDRDDMLAAARIIATKTPGAVLLKGGHLTDSADDLLLIKVLDGEDGEGDAWEEHWLSTELIDTPNTHGTGCTLSSAIASGLAMGKSLLEAVRDGKDYVTGAIANNPEMGRGSTGPLNHMWQM